MVMVKGLNLEWQSLKRHLDLQNNEKEVGGEVEGGQWPHSNTQSNYLN